MQTKEGLIFYGFFNFIVLERRVCIFVVLCCFVYMEEDNLIVYVLEVKQPRAFGLPRVVKLSLSQLPWIWREPTAVQEARYLRALN